MSLFTGIIDKIGVYLFGLLVLVGILAVGFWLWSVVDCLRSKKRSKWFWLLAIILLLVIGSMLYLLIEKKRRFSRRKEMQM